MTGKGTLIISLDFELHWGVRDVFSVDEYRENLLGARAAIPRILALFERYDIHATWATVGLLFFDTRDTLLAALPTTLPQYRHAQLSPYDSLHALGANEEEDPYHFAASLIRHIAATPNQEVATHTFAHYYCLEEGHDAASFAADLAAAVTTGRQYGYQLRSLVLPRNQLAGEYLPICRRCGITAYRGNEQSWVYGPKHVGRESRLRRGIRLLDAYLNLTGHHGYALERQTDDVPYNLPASRFFRPYSPALRWGEGLKIRRICNGLTHAATHGLAYHLWWHPHNFGTHTERNLAALDRVLDHYADLRNRYGMDSLSMGEVAENIRINTDITTARF